MSIASSLFLASAGSFPRVGDSFELQLLRRTIAALDRGERTTADLLDAENEMTRLAIADQVAAGLEVITDGLIPLDEPTRPPRGQTRQRPEKGAGAILRHEFLFSPAGPDGQARAQWSPRGE